MNLAAAFRGRLRASLPSLGEVAAGAVLWAAAMVLSAVLALQWRIAGQSANAASIALLYASGGALAFPPALFLARLAGLGRPSTARFAAAFLALSLLTVGITAFLFALVYRSFYAEWHGEPGTVLWGVQFVFTVITAVYHFAVIGLGLYLPVGGIALVGASLWVARRIASTDMR